MSKDYELDGMDGCGGGCPEPAVYSGSGRFVTPRAVATHEAEIMERFDALYGIGDGLVQMVEGISGFGDLGYTEALAYGDLDDLREGYPLGQVDVAGGSGYEFAEPGGGFVDDYGASASGWSDEPYEDDASAPPPDNRDIPQADTPTQAELADILEQRRQAIADAIKQRNLLTQKVTDLDHQIVEVLNPQYQQALAAGDEEAAVKLGGELRVLNLKRAEAVKKAVDWAQFQATASQMAKNVKAQLALNKLYQEVLTRQDPETAQAIQQAYLEIGQATAAIKQARAQALQQQKFMEAQQAAFQAQQNVAKFSAQVEQLAAQHDQLAKEIQALKNRRGAKVVPQAKITSFKQVKASLASAQSGLAAAQREFAQRSQALGPPQQPMYGPQGYPPMGMDPYAGYALPAFQGFDGLDDLDSLDATVPYCTLYTRDEYGPTCMKSGTMQLGDLGGFWDDFTRISTDVVTGGAAELAWNEKARDGLDQKVDKVGKVSTFIAKNVTCPVAKNLQKVTGTGKPTSGSIIGAFASSSIVGLCETPGKVKPLPVPVIVATETPVYKRWWFFPLCIAVGGVGYGIYRGLKTPQPRLQGFAGYRRRRHRR